jgi:hypothetical protein
MLPAGFSSRARDHAVRRADVLQHVRVQAGEVVKLMHIVFPLATRLAIDGSPRFACIRPFVEPPRGDAYTARGGPQSGGKIQERRRRERPGVRIAKQSRCPEVNVVMDDTLRGKCFTAISRAMRFRFVCFSAAMQSAALALGAPGQPGSRVERS